MLFLSREQVRMVDRLAIERYALPSIVLMENAARGATEVAISLLDGKASPSILILAGGGNNGGDGLAMARHLHNRGAEVEVVLTIDPAKYSGDALVNHRICQAMRLPVSRAAPALVARTKANLIIDAMFGTGLMQPPREPFREWVEAVEHSGKPVLAVDLPSGLDCDSGQPLGTHCVRATHTVTFVAQKLGFANPPSRAYTGTVDVADIGVPVELIDLVRRT